MSAKYLLCWPSWCATNNKDVYQCIESLIRSLVSREIYRKNTELQIVLGLADYVCIYNILSSKLPNSGVHLCESWSMMLGYNSKVTVLRPKKQVSFFVRNSVFLTWFDICLAIKWSFQNLGIQKLNFEFSHSNVNVILWIWNDFQIMESCCMLMLTFYSY